MFVIYEKIVYDVTIMKYRRYSVLIMMVLLCVLGHTYRVSGQSVMMTVEAKAKKKKSGLTRIDGKLYYYKDGKRKTGWVTVKEKKYYFYKTGKKKFQAAKGIKKIGDYYYGFKDSGVMRTGWVTSGDSYYYFKKKNGRAAVGKTTIAGKTYTFSKKGKISKEAKKKAEQKTKKESTAKKSGKVSSHGTSSKVLKSLDKKAYGLSSKTNYLIVVSRSNHRVAIYHGSKHNWKRLHVFKCSLGRSGHSTPRGSFAIGGHLKHFDSGGSRVWYASRFKTHYYFHSVLYRISSTPKKVKNGRLGRNISHGCIRLSLSHAKYIYSQIPSGTKVYLY